MSYQELLGLCCCHGLDPWGFGSALDSCQVSPELWSRACATCDIFVFCLAFTTGGFRTGQYLECNAELEIRRRLEKLEVSSL